MTTFIYFHHYFCVTFFIFFFSDKEIAPRTINDVKLINAGKILDNHQTIAESRVSVGELPGSLITMHVVVRPPVSDKTDGTSFLSLLIQKLTSTVKVTLYLLGLDCSLLIRLAIYFLSCLQTIFYFSITLLFAAHLLLQHRSNIMLIVAVSFTSSSNSYFLG